MQRQICAISCCVTVPIFRNLRRNGETGRQNEAGNRNTNRFIRLQMQMRRPSFWHLLDYGQKITLCDGIEVRFNDVGHLLGSASIEVWVTEGEVSKKIVFSGDVGNKNQPIIKDPQLVKEADYVVIESTYGDRTHGEDIPDYVGEFTRILRETFQKGGNVVIPSFAVGRTQEILYFIREIKEKNLLPEFPGFEVYVDSPLAIEATNVFNKNVKGCFDEDAMALVNQGINPLLFQGLKTTITSDESRQINFDTKPK